MCKRGKTELGAAAVQIVYSSDRESRDDRVRGSGGQPLDRASDRLVDPQVRKDRPPCRTIPAGLHGITAAVRLPGGLRDALDAINGQD